MTIASGAPVAIEVTCMCRLRQVRIPTEPGSSQSVRHLSPRRVKPAAHENRRFVSWWHRCPRSGPASKNIRSRFTHGFMRGAYGANGRLEVIDQVAPLPREEVAFGLRPKWP